MIQTPLVSIVCTTYNHQSYIKDALEGFVMQQTNFSFEIIVHDDASTDNTASIVKEYEEKFPELFVNIYQTVNQFSLKEVNIWTEITFPIARGKYIALCEGDDYWTDPLKLQKQVDFLERNKEYSMVCHDALILNQIDNFSRLFYNSNNKKHTFSTNDTFNVHLCPTASILFRKLPDFLNEQFSKGRNSGDQMLIQLISLTGLIFRMDDVMSVYRILPQGISQVSIEGLIRGLKDKIANLLIFNEVSDKRFQKDIWLTIFVIKRRIKFLKNPSTINRKLFSFSKIVNKGLKKIF
ncbi:MAG TPA: glycosyltransferase [Hanamia sp.]|nr:glycosyltransferase [Hanamia sp.]